MQTGLNWKWKRPTRRLFQSNRRSESCLKKGILPELRALPENPGSFDTIILGYPIYWGTYPTAVKTFLKSCNLKGKIILPFSTHEGSGPGHSVEDLKTDLPDSKVLPCLAISGDSVEKSEGQIEEWLKHSL